MNEDRMFRIVLVIVCVLAALALFPPNVSAAQFQCGAKSGQFVADTEITTAGLRVTIAGTVFDLQRDSADRYSLPLAHVAFVKMGNLDFMTISIGELPPPGADFLTMWQYLSKHQVFRCSRQVSGISTGGSEK